MKITELKKMIQGVRLAKIQTSGDGCSIPGEVLVFVPDTPTNRKRFSDWAQSPTNFRVKRNGEVVPFAWLCEQFTID